jgi:hypothetical protein
MIREYTLYKGSGMRLLEFNLDTGGANPRSKPAARPPSKKVVRPVRLGKPAASPEIAGTKFPLKPGKTAGIARKPIDLEQLQQRIELLERRIQERSQGDDEHPASRDLELLKQRVERMQQSIHSELWAARQREHTMLQILSRPSFKTATIQRLEHFRSKQLPAAARWLMATSGRWWQECQPDWWAGLAKAWQESLDKARGLPHN